MTSRKFFYKIQVISHTPFFTPHYVDEREDLESVTLTLAFLQQL